ncbi:hypothetical protein RND81_12G085300 [Saponaria officinalis]|uniref:ApaG domain-containing protein n=1 Tax=Saponaria officinalis TaxID=3572 RepID=A0AAW1H844_SAPOF
MTEIEGIGDLGVHIIISKLDPNETATISCVSKKFKEWASDDTFWATHCFNDLNLSSPIDPFGNPLPSFKVAYQLWREAFSSYPWVLLKRVKRCWDTLKSWMDSNFPELLTTLRRGASEEELNEVEKSLKIKLPIPTRLLYRMHDGQELKDKLLGLIGGYRVYDHMVNVHLLPLKQVIFATKHITHAIGFSSTSKFISIAASVTEREKFFCLNCSNYQLYVGTANLRDGEMMPCVPSALLKCSGDQQSDGVLLWLEEHGRRLQNGMITIREEGDFKSICQFPDKPPLCTTAVTNGVQVRASAVLVPEQSDLQKPGYFFAYSIRMSLLPEGCTVHGMTFNSCQLNRRHWIIREDEIVKGDVEGEAVIGKYPLLRPGEKEFVYESCTPQYSSHGSIEGSFTFVPGRLVAPKGDPFKVEVARFELVMPEYIF